MSPSSPSAFDSFSPRSASRSGQQNFPQIPGHNRHDYPHQSRNLDKDYGCFGSSEPPPHEAQRPFPPITGQANPYSRRSPGNSTNMLFLGQHQKQSTKYKGRYPAVAAIRIERERFSQRGSDGHDGSGYGRFNELEPNDTYPAPCSFPHQSQQQQQMPEEEDFAPGVSTSLSPSIPFPRHSHGRSRTSRSRIQDGNQNLKINNVLENEDDGGRYTALFVAPTKYLTPTEEGTRAGS